MKKSTSSIIRILLIVTCFYCVYDGCKRLLFNVDRYTIKAPEKSEWLVSREQAVKRYSQKQDRTRISSEGVSCPLPHLNPFDENIVKFMSLKSDNCQLKKYAVVRENLLELKSQSDITSVYLQYIQRGASDQKLTITNEKNYLDDEFTLSDKIQLKEKEGYYHHVLTEDFIRVIIYFGSYEHVEHHATLSKTKTLVKSKPLEDIETRLRYNVILYMIDSLSHANFKRQLILTDEAMSNDEDTVIFNGHTIVGDGTTAALSALLTGIPEEKLPETRRGFTNKTCDQYDMIFKDFEKRGYVTFFGEEDTASATFNYRLNGFFEPPTSWYLRPFFLSLNKENKFTNNRDVCGTEQSIKTVKTFMNAFKNQAKFGMAVTSFCSHNNINNVQTVDKQIKDLYIYFKNHPENKNTILILFGDHGLRYGPIRNTLQGKMEERLPFLSMILPKGFKNEHKELYDNLRWNSNILTTPFDTYMTLQHILSFPNIPKAKTYGQSLFTKIDPSQRTCAKAGVEDHWCPCFNKKSIGPTSKESIDIVNEFIKSINEFLLEFKESKINCAKVYLKQIDRVSKRTVNEKVDHFVESKRNEVCDSCGVVSSEGGSEKSFTIYEVSFVVLPSKGSFEASGRFRDGKLLDTPVFSRTNKYGNQPACIMKKYPHLRPFCYCKTSKKMVFFFLKNFLGDVNVL